jgi:hypothetical protein
MSLLKPIDTVDGIDFYEYRDFDYYNKYEYRVKFTLPGIRYCYYTPTVESFMERYKLTSGYKSIRKEDKHNVGKHLEAIKSFIVWRNLNKTDKKTTVRIEGNSASIFSNDLSLLKTIENIDPNLSYEYTQVKKSQFQGVKYFVNKPKYSYRIYFKSKLVSKDFAKDFSTLLEQTKELHPSSALKRWLLGSSMNPNNWRYRYFSSSYFVDYDQESTISYLALMHNEMLGKRYKLEKRP